MGTANHERPARVQFDRATPETGARRGGVSSRTVAFVLLGLVALLVLTTLLYIVRLTYRPRRGC